MLFPQNLKTKFAARRLRALLITTTGFMLLLSGNVFSQSRQIPAPPQDQPILLHSTTIHPVTAEPIDDGFILFENGVITAMGPGYPPTVQPGTQRIDASGMHVYPGLIAAKTNLGLTETGAVDVTHDYAEFGRIKPEVRAAVAINPDSDLIPVARANGILTAMIFPQGGLLGGRCSTVRLDGWTWEQMTHDDHAGLVVNWPRTEPINAWWMDTSESDQRKEIKKDLSNLEKVFDNALAYCIAKDNDNEVKTDLRYESMRPFLTGERPIYVSASSVGQIESAVAWAVRRGLRIIIVGGAQADQAIGILSKHEIPVILEGTHHLPRRRHEAYDQPFTIAVKLLEAGIPFCIASGAGAAHERNLNHNAATAAAYGLSKDEALQAVTINAARIIGLGSTHGSLELAKSATVIVTTGDPLQITTDTLLAFIDGRRIDLGNRQKTLYRKYREKYRQLGLLEDTTEVGDAR